MKHRVGNIEIEYESEIGRWAYLTMHYNEYVRAKIDLRCEQDLYDLEYAVQTLMRQFREDKAKRGQI